MSFPETLVMGATGRIGQLLQCHWTTAAVQNQVLWQRRGTARLGPAVGAQVSVDPLEDPAGLAQAASQAQAAVGRQILCLAGVIPGRGNLADNWRLAAAALRAAAPGQRVILCSSAAVYGDQPGLLAEGAARRPVTKYGQAKLEMEQRSAGLAADLGVPLCVLRIGNIAGLDGCLGGWRPGFQLDQFADGSTPTRSYIGVATLARVLADLLAQPQLPPVLNLAQMGGLEMGALLTAAGRHWTPRPAPAAAIARVVMKTTLLQDLVRVPGADAVKMVQEWRGLEPKMIKRQNRE